RYAEEPSLREIMDERPALRQLSERTRRLPAEASYYDRIELGQAVAGAMGQKAERDAQMILGRLRPATRDVAVDRAGSERALASMSFLVRRKDLRRFEALAETVRQQVAPRIDVRVRGPLPPFSFVDAELDAAGAGA